MSDERLAVVTVPVSEDGGTVPKFERAAENAVLSTMVRNGWRFLTSVVFADHEGNNHMSLLLAPPPPGVVSPPWWYHWAMMAGMTAGNALLFYIAWAVSTN